MNSLALFGVRQMETFKAFSFLSKTHRVFRFVSVCSQNQSSSKAILKQKPEDIDVVSHDLSDITPYFPNTFNLAAYVNKSELLQNLLHLNVDLSRIEKKPHITQKILKLDLEILKGCIIFLSDYVNAEEMGNYITRNPMIFFESMDDLCIRINYLQSKKFSESQIKRIISKNAYWLMFSTSRIDRRLGHFQQKFDLSGDEVRELATKQSKLITYNMHHITVNTFVLKEEIGFEDNEIKQILLQKPRLWMINQKSLQDRFNYIHNIMKIPHSIILLYPEVLLCRSYKLKQRHLFLQKLGRDQYDPKKENYVSIKALAEGTDTDFCNLIAKCNVNDFNLFLKTL